MRCAAGSGGGAAECSGRAEWQPGAGTARRPGLGGPMRGGRAVRSGAGARRGPAAARVQVGLAGRGVPGAWGRRRGSEERRRFPVWGFSPGLSEGSPYCFLLADLVEAPVAQIGLQGTKPFGVLVRGSWV